MAPKVFIVTGASRGIGLAVTQYLLKAPENKVVAVSRSPDELARIKEQAPSQVEVLVEDMTREGVRQQACRSYGILTPI